MHTDLAMVSHRGLLHERHAGYRGVSLRKALAGGDFPMDAQKLPRSIGVACLQLSSKLVNPRAGADSNV